MLTAARALRSGRHPWHFCKERALRRSRGLRSVSGYGRASSADEAWPKAQAEKVRAIEKDLSDLDATFQTVVKKDLHVLRNKWMFKDVITGNDITLAEAREAVRRELSTLADEQRALAMQPARRAAGGAEESLSNGRKAAIGVGVVAFAGAGFAAYQFLAGSTPIAGAPAAGAPALDGPSSAVAAAGPATTGTAVAGGAGRASAARAAASAPAATRRDAPEAADVAAGSGVAASGAAAPSSGAAASPGAPGAAAVAAEGGDGGWPSPRHLALGLACAGGLALGVWWLLRPRLPPEAGPDLTSKDAAPSGAELPVGASSGQGPADVRAAEAPAAAITPSGSEGPGRPRSSLDLGTSSAAKKAKSAVEEVFENIPDQGQTWDMSASVRGIQGGVQSRVSQFDKK